MTLARAKAENDWNHTSALMAQIHNILAKRPKKPQDFNPMLKADSEKEPMTIGDLKRKAMALDHGD